MRLFGKKYPSRQDLVVTNDWTVIHGLLNGRPLITRFNVGLKELAGHPDYDHQVGIAVPLETPNDHGLPGVEEDRQLGQVEDAIANVLEEGHESLLAGVISTGGMREFVFYTSDPAAVRQKFERLCEEITSHRIQLMIQQDPRWSVYNQFT